MSTTITSPSIQDLVKSGASIAEIRASVDPQCNGLVDAAVNAGYGNGQLSAAASLQISGSSIPQWILMVASSPDGNTTYCSAFTSNPPMTAMAPTAAVIVASAQFPAPAPGTQVLATLVGQLVAESGACQFLFQETVTL